MGVLDGIWHGYYLEESVGDPSARATSYPIKVSFESKGTGFVGQMIDEKPVRHQLLRAVYQELRYRLTPKQREDFEAVLRIDPKAHRVSTLPANSKVIGRVAGRQVTFTKRYEGVHKVEDTVLGKSTVVYQNHRHCVEYVGELDADSDALEGQWTIYKRTGLLRRKKSPEATGRFRLDRR